MTESSFPFEAPAEQPEAAGTDRRKMAVVAGAGALAVAVLGYFVVLPAFAGDDSAPVTAVRAPRTQTTKGKAAAKPAAKAPAKPAPVQPESYADVRGREHPFRPLWNEPVKAATGAAPATSGTGTVPAAPGTVTGPTTPSSSGSSASVGGQRVALMTVYEKDGVQFAQAKIGDVVYSPKVGQVFAVSYKLLATSGKTATFLYGDEQFTLSVGQEVLK